MFYNGNGVFKKNFGKAFKYLEKAGEGEDVQLLLASLYVGGNGVKKSLKTGIKIYEKLEKMGSLQAVMNLGKIFENQVLTCIKKTLWICFSLEYRIFKKRFNIIKKPK